MRQKKYQNKIDEGFLVINKSSNDARGLTKKFNEKSSNDARGRTKEFNVHGTVNSSNDDYQEKLRQPIIDQIDAMMNKKPGEYY